MSNAASVRTVVTETTEQEHGFRVTIGMNHRITVTSEGDAGVSLATVIQNAVSKLGLTGDEADIVNNGGFTQNVIVNGERVDDPGYVVEEGSTVYVDQRKRNG